MMINRFSSEYLYRIRNEVPIPYLLEYVFPCHHKHSHGILHFLCPNCGNFNATVNPKNNLAHCFSCGKNFNNIDLAMTLKNLNFPDAVSLLASFLP